MLCEGALLGVVAEGIVGVSPAAVVEVATAADHDARRDLVRELATGSERRASSPDQAALAARLVDAGVLAPDGPGPARPAEDEAGIALLDALADPDVLAEGGTVWGGEQALVVPGGLGRSLIEHALDAFAAGLDPPARLTAYAWARERGEPTVIGDEPEEALRRAALAAPDGPISVVSVDGTVTALEPEELERLGATRPHRLGTVLSAELVPAVWIEHPDLVRAVALHAAPAPQVPSLGFGMGVKTDPEEALLVARAEAAQRWCAAWPQHGAPLCRARREDVEAPVDPAEIYAQARAQRLRGSRYVPYRPEEELVWVAGSEPDGRRRHVPAEAVYSSWQDRRRGRRAIAPAAAGTAVHTDAERAYEGALVELIERDALMYTWAQGLVREHLHPDRLGDTLRARVDVLRRAGLEVALLNLTLDTLPVVLAVAYDDASLTAGIACRPDPRAAALRAVEELSAVGWLDLAQLRTAMRPADVRSPQDHLLVHWSPHAPPRTRALIGGSDRVDPEDVLPGPAPSAARALSAAVAPPVRVDLGHPRIRPFTGVRVVVPGLLPLAFGHDCEPLGMPRITGPIACVDGVTRGARLEPAGQPLSPHPLS